MSVIQQDTNVLIEDCNLELLNSISEKLLYTNCDLTESQTDLLIKLSFKNASSAYKCLSWSGRYNSLTKNQRIKLLEIIIENDFDYLIKLFNSDYTKRIKLYEMKFIESVLSTQKLKKIMEVIYQKNPEKLKKLCQQTKSGKMEKIFIMLELM